MKETKKVIESVIINILDKEWNCKKQDDGTYIYSIDADYRDKMSTKDIVEILESPDPLQTLSEKVWEGYSETDCQYLFEMEKFITEYLEELGIVSVEDEVYDMLMELVSCTYPIEHFLGQELCVNIMVDTGDGNYDFCLNHVYPAYDGDIDEPLDDKAGIVWLSATQGYDKETLKAALDEENFSCSRVFLKSMRQEVANVTSHINVTTFLVKMSLRNAIELNKLIRLQDRDGHFYDATERPDCGCIVIDKDTKNGLFDPWNGGGSLLDVELEKDVVLPIRFIRSAWPDGCDGYGIDDVYGMYNSAWDRGGVKEIHAPAQKAEYKIQS